jgi:hypothetical protein
MSLNVEQIFLTNLCQKNGPYSPQWWSVSDECSFYTNPVQVFCSFEPKVCLFLSNRTTRRERQQEDGALPYEIQHNTLNRFTIITQTIMREVTEYIIMKITTQVLYTKTKLKKKLNSVAFSSQANYTDRATAACRRI